MVQPTGRIKIVDFGIARLESTSGHTQTGAVIGTFHYIAPERLKGDPSDSRADLWSVGVMLYQVLTGRLPFGGDDISAMHRVVSEPFEPISQFLVNYPRGLDQVVDRALAKNPEERYQTGEEMASDLEAVIEVLKREQVSDKLAQVQRLMAQEQLASARSVLLELQRLDPQNATIKRQLREVQETLARQQRAEQIRQLTMQADEAALALNYVNAIDLYRQAAKIDPETGGGFTDKIEQLRSMKERADKVALLHQQARDARSKHDLTAAQRYLEQALALDGSSADMRNELTQVMQESERIAREGHRRRLVQTGREKFSGRQYMEAIENLREALQLDPSDKEVQQLYQNVLDRQEEDRRRKVIEQIVAEIQDCVVRQDLDRALELIQRALEKLPGEPALLRLKADTEKAHRESTAQTLFDQTAVETQSMGPQEALHRVQAALDQLPGEPRLMALQERLIEQLKRANLEGLRADYLKRAQACVDGRQYDQAIQILENAAIDCGESPDVAYLQEYARAEKNRDEQAQAANAAVQRAQTLIASGELEAAVALLQPVVEQTGNPAADQLLRQTAGNLAEVNRRVDAVLERVQALGQREAPQALQLLESQPTAVQQHSKLRDVRGRLQRSSEQERATREAMQQTEDRLANRELTGLLEPLESVQRAYGESAVVTAAIAEFADRRRYAANEMLVASMEAARQCILVQQPARALQAIETYATVVEFADPAAQADWKRLAQEAAKAAGPKTATTTGKVQIVVGSGGLSAPLVWGIVAAVVLAVPGGLIWYVKFSGMYPLGMGPVTYMRITATPFAEVVSVTSNKGKSVAIPDGEHNTPLRVDGVPEGAYDVVYKLPDGTTATKTGCQVDDSEHLCTLTSADVLTDSQIEAIISGQGAGGQK
jgi:eukaryotic-like serine/threonine-protein kinase